jgi:hypothetical protein
MTLTKRGALGRLILSLLELPSDRLALQRMAYEGPVRRDGLQSLPFDQATRLLGLGLIERGTEKSCGLVATMSWRIWRITSRGRKVLRWLRS